MQSLEEGKSVFHTEETHEKSHSDARELGQETGVVTLLTSRQLQELRTHKD